MRRRHGLTLVEVLASTVLLTLVAATCMPLLRQAMRGLREPATPFELLELVEFADAFVADPAAFGFDEIQPVDGEAQLESPWPQDPDRPAVAVRRLTVDDQDADHAWLTFTCDRWTVCRWKAVEPQEDLDDRSDQGEGDG